ncbi:MAG: hypothetical protein WBF79_01380 [Rhodococcus sp. (in: high G+C Gram-positive bacteria)]
MAEIHLDSAGMEEMLTVTCREAIDAAAASIVSGVPSRAGRTSTRGYTTDRAAAAVIVAKRGALAIEAREGNLIRAASIAGLEVHGGI